ncbi:MAG: efflux RND transporter periplasmic adaptor subunit [Verrucomicrobiae bacterium]|nr:efflux RND transporter periplasmic adaptor subunit [Verrucomicrobiae bacterium]NNJ43592.1 biotin/lipoyl-binding protein [Akkermansiaceae bacterium]
MKSLIADNRGGLLLVLITCVALVVLTCWVIYPAYQKSNNGLYSSRLGYPSVLRSAGRAIPVTVKGAEIREVERYLMGEGVCASQPLLVPIIPMALVEKVHVVEGQRVAAGELLATLDSGKAKIKYESAKLAVSTAAAELERVRLGSAYVLAQERPEVEKINLDAMQRQQNFAKEKLDRYDRAFKKGVISKVAHLEAQEQYSKVTEQLSQARLSMRMAERGVLQSLKIAENALGDAQQALAHREEELKAYHVYAPDAGVVDRVLIQSGEYNQDSGKPGFLISNGLWFDVYFDQSDYAYVHHDQVAEVSLESQPGNDLLAHVAMVKPMVSFNNGGPEISRPLRPRGSGSPEWAATFKVKLDFKNHEALESVVTGMTGFARLKIANASLTVPRAAVMSISASSAVVYVVADDDAWSIRPVRVGHVGMDDVEILHGLEPGEQVIVDGQSTLKTDDKIEVHRK